MYARTRLSAPMRRAGRAEVGTGNGEEEARPASSAETPSAARSAMAATCSPPAIDRLRTEWGGRCDQGRVRQSTSDLQYTQQEYNILVRVYCMWRMGLDVIGWDGMGWDGI